jgi:hypothetical protein
MIDVNGKPQEAIRLFFRDNDVFFKRNAFFKKYAYSMRMNILTIFCLLAPINTLVRSDVADISDAIETSGSSDEIHNSNVITDSENLPTEEAVPETRDEKSELSPVEKGMDSL